LNNYGLSMTRFINFNDILIILTLLNSIIGLYGYFSAQSTLR